MDVEVCLRTTLEFESVDDINEIQDMIYCDMTPEEILVLATQQGNPINIDVEG